MFPTQHYASANYIRAPMMNSYLELSDDEIRKRLSDHGMKTGPVTPTTRKLYVSRLKKLDESLNSSMTSTPKNNITNTPNKREDIIRERIGVNSPRIIRSSSHRRVEEKVNLDDSLRTLSRPMDNSKRNTSLTPEYSPVKKRSRPLLSRLTNFDNILNLNQYDSTQNYILSDANDIENKYDDVIDFIPSNKAPQKASLVEKSVHVQSKFMSFLNIFKKIILLNLKFTTIRYIVSIIGIFIGFGFIYPLIFQIVNAVKPGANHLFGYVMNIIVVGISLVMMFALYRFLRFLYARFRQAKDSKTREIFDMVDKVIEIIHTRYVDYHARRSISPSIPILHIRDMIIPPNERNQKSKIWTNVVDFIRIKESRVRTKVERISGQDLHVWEWIGPNLSKAQNSEVDSSRISIKSEVYNHLSRCVKVRFSGNELVVANYSCIGENIHKSFVDATISSGYKINHINYSKHNKNVIYMKFESKQDAVSFYNRFNSTYFSQYQVIIRFVHENKYNQNFDE